MKNKLKQILANGEPAIGSWIGFSDPYAVEMMADMGFDWLLVDMEHIPISQETLRTILMACKGSDSVPAVRVPVNSADYIQAALDLVAQGVMTTMVNSARDAKCAVEFSRYPPWGVAVSVRFAPAVTQEDVDTYRREAIGGDMSFLANRALAELSGVRRLLLTAKHWLVES